MSASIFQMFGRALRQALGRIARAGLAGLLAGAGLVEGLALIFNHAAGTATVVWAWPPIVDGSAFTLFVHVLAGVVGVLLGALLAFGVGVVQTLRGVVFAADHVDEAAGAVVDGGLNLADAAVDAVDGPNRHGFRGKRGTTVVR